VIELCIVNFGRVIIISFAVHLPQLPLSQLSDYKRTSSTTEVVGKEVKGTFRK
jgi:hypothetical protein